MTNSPPSNVKRIVGEPPCVLASGIDTLVLAVDLSFTKDDAFELLATLKRKAKMDKEDATGKVQPANDDAWLFTIKRFGKDGYEWLLNSCELSMSLSASAEPGPRPNAMVHFSSEALWHQGPEGCVRRMIGIFEAMHAVVKTVKASRADMCVDVLLDESSWKTSLKDCLVTRAVQCSEYTQNSLLSGFTIGAGKLQARFYDKPLEIRQKSKKFWMYDIWGIENVPEACRLIRVEYQMRREVLKELDVNTFEDLLRLSPNVWKYCSESWLKVQDDAKLHHTQQTTLPWWVVVQNGFEGSQGACPAVRAKAVQTNELQILQQMVGYAVADTALLRGDMLLVPGEILDSASHIRAVAAALERLGMTSEEFTERVKRKQAKTRRAKEKHNKAVDERLRLGLSSDEPSSTDSGQSS